MALKVNRQNDMDAMFGKFADMDPEDKKRDKFLKHDNKDKDKKRQHEKRPPNKWF